MVHTMNDEELLKELLVYSLEDIPSMLSRLKDLHNREGTDSKMAELAHKIKGSAGAVSGEKLYHASFELEVMSNEGRKKEVKNQIEQVEKAFNEFSRDAEVMALTAT